MEKPLLLLSWGKKGSPQPLREDGKAGDQEPGVLGPQTLTWLLPLWSCLLSGRPLGSWLTQSSVSLRGSKAFRLSHHQSLTVGRWRACVYFLVVLGTSDAPAWAGACTARFAHVSA